MKLIEIVDFFSRSRLGTKGLTIINQGEADLFVKASAEERRIMIEEILGLREYQIKKTEAERKLKNTFINLEKVKAMVEEVIPRLRMLKRQTNKWEKRAAVQKESNDFENEYFSRKLNEIKNSRKEFEPLLDSLENQIKEREGELKILESELKKVESQLQAPLETKFLSGQERQEINPSALLRIDKQKLLTERSYIQKELGRIEAKSEFLAMPKTSGRPALSWKNEDLLSLVNETKEILSDCLIYSDFEDLKKTINKLVVKIDKFLNSDAKGSELRPKRRSSEKDLADLENSKNNLEAKLNIIEAEFKKLEEQEMKITTSLEEFNKKFQEAFELVELKRKELRELDRDKKKIIFNEKKGI